MNATDISNEVDSEPLKSPFPAFGGKSRIAETVWERFGVGVDAPRNYIEPFCFSAAMTLRRPEIGQVETINDRNAFVSNFWRAASADPDAVAEHADWPVNEVDLHARHRWLVGSATAAAALERVREDPDYFDARIAGWWCWGACCWIGSGWCDEVSGLAGRWPALAGDGMGNGVARDLSQQIPHMGGAGQGVTSGPTWDGAAKRMQYNQDGLGNGIARLPLMPNAECPMPLTPDTHRPAITDGFSRGRGVNGGMEDMTRERRRAWITAWMHRLADRLRSVRVCCGHWDRVCDSPSTMTRMGTTAVFLDPPYRVTLACGKKNRTAHIYANDKHQDVNALCDEVQAWCLKWGSDPMVRIALCGLEGEYPEVERAGWEVFAWKSNGGYGNRKGSANNENARRERVWFSPHCLKPSVEEIGLFQ